MITGVKNREDIPGGDDKETLAIGLTFALQHKNMEYVYMRNGGIWIRWQYTLNKSGEWTDWVKSDVNWRDEYCSEKSLRSSLTYVMKHNNSVRFI